MNASDAGDWLNATRPDGAEATGWECSRERQGHPVALAVAPALETLMANMKLAYMLHVYGIACLFAVLATYTFFSLINLRALISSRPFMTSINVFLCLLGTSRAAYLMLDPYNLRQMMPRILGALLWELAFPCLASAFCLIQLAFLQLTQLKVGPKPFREKTVPSLVIAVHFSFVLGINILLGFDDSVLPFKYAGETLFACWAAVLFASFLSLSKHVRRLLNRVPQGVLLQRDPTDCHAKGIMQLAMLAPYSNLASSVAAALVPTLLAPRFHQGETQGPRRTGSTAPGASKVSPAPAAVPPTASRAPACPPGPPPVIKTEDVSGDNPVVRVRPATPTITVCPGSRRGSTASLSRRGSSCLEAGLAGEGTSRRRSSCGLEPILPEDGGPPSRRGSAASLLRIAEEGPSLSALDASTSPASPSPTRRKKSLSWKGDDDLCQAPEPKPTKSQPEVVIEDTTTAETKLLPLDQDTGFKTDDVTLHSILTHIAYVNRGPRANSEERAQSSNRRRQLREVIHLTSATAVMGLLLCAAAVFQLFGPYGQLVGRCGSGRGPVWLWFAFQTLCRLMELAMGCAMASVTKQPVSGPQSGYMHHSHYAAGLRLKRESLYL